MRDSRQVHSKTLLMAVPEQVEEARFNTESIITCTIEVALAKSTLTPPAKATVTRTCPRTTQNSQYCASANKKVPIVTVKGLQTLGHSRYHQKQYQATVFRAT